MKPMTRAQVELAQSSFVRLVPISDAAASVFYGHLFERAPDVRRMFKRDMTEQGRKLMLTLGTIVHALDQPETMLRTARALAVRHVGYGVRVEHYEAVGVALIAMLETVLGRSFTGEMREAWTRAYAEVSGAMIAEAYGKAA